MSQEVLAEKSSGFIRADLKTGGGQKAIPYRVKLAALTIIAAAAAILYEFISVDVRYAGYAMALRSPKLLAMLIAAFCIGAASVAFQTIIHNTIVTPCLLGMNSLYTLIHAATVFILGTTSVLTVNKSASFVIDLFLMSIVGVVVYSYLFRKIRYNILYILLAGIVLSTFFTSLTNSLIRVMDPNDYATLQNSLIAGFNRVNTEMLGIAILSVCFTALALRRDIMRLNVISLGRLQAMSLGVEYDKTVRRLLFGVTVLIATATALVGPISFLGLIIANLSRQIFATYRHLYLMVGAALTGMIILVVGQTLIERVFAFNATIDVFVNIGGGVYFLYLLVRNRNR